MRTIAGIYSPRLVCLRPILLRWIRLNQEIAGKWYRGNDVPWWYNERASLSVLAGAAWRSKGIAFEEYSDRKRFRSKRADSSFRSYAGRVDIYIEINRHYFIGEAKSCWPTIPTRSRNQSQYIERFLTAAKRDIRKSRPDGQRRLAIVFVSPIVSRKRKGSIQKHINEFVDQAKDTDADAVAWVFPNTVSNVVDNGRLYPGTAVIIKEVRK